MENHLQILHIPISPGSKFQLQQTISILVGEICPRKEFFGQKKMNSALNQSYSNQSKYQASAQADNFDFLDQVCPKKAFPIKNRQSKFTVEFGRFESKFQLKLTILTFRTKFAQKWYSQSKTKKVSTNIELCIFESVQVANFSLN